jgi:hypothetical protein
MTALHTPSPAVDAAIDAMLARECLQEHEPNQVHAWITRADGSVEDLGIAENLRTTVGADWQAGVMGSSSQPASAQYIALTTNATAPAAGDTTLTSEINSGGLARAIGTYSHTNGTSSYKITKVFTATASHTAVAKAGLFNASSSGTMVFETLLASTATLAIDDTLTIEWTVNI